MTTSLAPITCITADVEHDSLHCHTSRFHWFRALPSSYQIMLQVCKFLNTHTLHRLQYYSIDYNVKIVGEKQHIHV